MWLGASLTNLHGYVKGTTVWAKLIKYNQGIRLIKSNERTGIIKLDQRIELIKHNQGMVLIKSNHDIQSERITICPIMIDGKTLIRDR